MVKGFHLGEVLENELIKAIRAPREPELRVTKPLSEPAIVQLALKGMWTKAVKGCPHRVGSPDVDRCGEDEMRPCIYELAYELRHGGCQTFRDIIHEWQKHYHIVEYEPDYYKELPRFREGILQ